MKTQGPFATFRSWERAVDGVFHRLDSAAGRLETTLPSRIPRPVLRGVNRTLGLLESRWIAAFLLFFLLASSRAVHWLANPQFYIEDGPEFYITAFNQGLHCISRSYASYYHVVPRVLSVLAVAFPLRYGPLAVEIAALFVQSSVSAFLLSRRMAKQLPSKLLRFGLAFFVVADPNSTELFANVAHSQWYLGILSLAILCSEPGRRAMSSLGDGVLLLLTGLTGPFAPVMAIFSWSPVRDLRSRWLVLVVTTLTAAVTAASMIEHPRNGINTDAGAAYLCRLLTNQILYGTVRGFHYAYHTVSDPNLNLREFGCAVFGIAVIVAGLWKAPSFLRALGWLGLYCLVTALFSRASWNLLGCPGVGERYFLYLDIVFVYGLFALSRQARSALVRWGFRGLLLITAVAIVQEWVYDPPFSRFDFAPQIAGYDNLRPGETIEVRTPIDRKSPAAYWTITIPKKD
ncbi:MAG: hypothetical protein P4L46_17925 [Fimbriimonas sp.]|nr:hypothetical protein [Fimbriimonas sp.]